MTYNVFSGTLNPTQSINQACPTNPVWPDLTDLHRAQQKVPILYNGTPVLTPKICPFPWGDLNLHLIHGPLGPAKSSTQTAS